MRRGRGFNPEEVRNLRSWGVEPRPDEIELPITSRWDSMIKPWRPKAPAIVSAEEAAADERRRLADIERQMGLRPR